MFSLFPYIAVYVDEVIECGVCHGATSALLPYFKQHLDHESVTEYYMLFEGCQVLSAKYHDIVSFFYLNSLTFLVSICIPYFSAIA